jgi:hypothetical protein
MGIPFSASRKILPHFFQRGFFPRYFDPKIDNPNLSGLVRKVHKPRSSKTLKENRGQGAPFVVLM